MWTPIYCHSDTLGGQQRLFNIYILIILFFVSIAKQYLIPYLLEGRTTLLEDVAILTEAQDNPWTNTTIVLEVDIVVIHINRHWI